MDSRQIGKRIKEVRKKQGLDQDSFGTEIGVSATSISGWEKGRRQPRLEHIVKIAKMTHTSLDYIVFGKKHPQNIVASISPGERGTSNIEAAQNRPTIKLQPLKRIVAWLDNYFVGEYEDQALSFYDDIRDNYLSFRLFTDSNDANNNTAIKTARTGD